MKAEWLRHAKGSSTVVFVHGILSSGESCWRNANGAYWPDLIAAERSLNAFGIYIYSYSTNFFSGTYSLSDVVDDLKERMRLDGLFASTELIFVCHSMGGIVVRKLLVERVADFVKSKITCGLYLVASPSLGTAYATWLTPLAAFLGHKQARALAFSKTNDWLNDLDKEFQNLKEAEHFPIYGKELVEDKFIILKKAWKPQVVTPISGARYFGERLKIPESDHFSISKPADSSAIQHRALVAFITSVAAERPSEGLAHNPVKLTLREIDSTNDYSLRKISEGHRLPFLVHAWSQTRGRGKEQRIWQGGIGILTATWNYPFQKAAVTPKVLSLLSVVSCLAVREAVRLLNPIKADVVQVKWPNDVLVGGKKVAGILIEVTEQDSQRICTIGIGLNVARIPTLTDATIYTLPPAAVFDDFENEFDREARIERAIELITASLTERLSRLLSDRGLGAQEQEWVEADHFLNKQIHLRTPQSDTELWGIDRGINSSGQLVIEFDKGHKRSFFSAEVSALSGQISEAIEVDEKADSIRRVVDANGNNVDQVLSPMPMRIQELLSYVVVGSIIAKGSLICVGEAMKCAFKINAPISGRVTKVHIAPGDMVDTDQPLITLQAIESAPESQCNTEKAPAIEQRHSSVPKSRKRSRPK